MPECAGEMLRLAQRPLDAGGRNIDGVLARVVAQQIGDTRTERVVDPGRVVDVHGEAVGALQLDREHLDAVEGSFHTRADLALQLPLLLP